MAITGSVYAPGSVSSGTTATKWVAEEWAKRFDVQAYEKAAIWSKIDDVGRLGNRLHIPKHDNLTAASVGDSTDMSSFGLTFSANTEGEITFTPGTVNVNVSVNENVLQRMQFDPTDDLRQSMEAAVAQYIDQDVASLFSGLTTNVVGDYASDIDLPKILEARSKVKAGAKQFADPGKYLFFYHHLQDDNVMSIGQLTQAYARGDSQNPSVSGVIQEAYGIQFIPTGNVRSSGGGFNNCLTIGRAFGIGFNSRPSVKAQPNGLATFLLAWCDYGKATKRDAYACLIKSKNT
jgi:hypothetical protein